MISFTLAAGDLLFFFYFYFDLHWIKWEQSKEKKTGASLMLLFSTGEINFIIFCFRLQFFLSFLWIVSAVGTQIEKRNFLCEMKQKLKWTNKCIVATSFWFVSNIIKWLSIKNEQYFVAWASAHETSNKERSQNYIMLPNGIIKSKWHTIMQRKQKNSK